MTRTVFLVVTMLVMSAGASAREWTDASGQYKFKGEVVAEGDTMIILQRDDKEKDLVAIDIDQLSKQDQEYLEKRAERAKEHPEMRTYTTRSGFKVRAAVIDYITRKVEIYRHRGKPYVNGYQFENLPGVYRRVVPEVVNHFEKTELDQESFPTWVKELEGKRKTYECEGVLAELENGDHYAFPFFLLSQEDLKYLEPGYEDWANEQEDSTIKEEYALRMRAEAMESRRQQAERRQFAKLHLMLQGVQAGVTSLWEVTLIPTNKRGLMRKVVVPGRDSRQATAYALSKFPGYRAGPARQVSRGGRF